MARILSILAALLLFAAPAAAADAKVTKIIWRGQSFFEIISKGGTHVILDPHAIESFGRDTYRADLVLCSHNHSDHTQLSVIDNIKDLQKNNKVFIGTKGEDKKSDWVKIDGKLRDVTFKNIPTYHDDNDGLTRGKNSILVIDVDGLRIVHLGDLGHTLDNDQLEKIGVGKVDVLLVPIGGVYTLNGLRAQDVVKQIQPKRFVVPMHYGVPGFDDLLTLDKSAFLDRGSDDYLKELKVQRFPMTNVLEVDCEDKPGKYPIIAILNWKKQTEK